MRWLAVVAAVVLLAGCGKETEPSRNESAKIVWKTPALKYADMAFLRVKTSSVEMELYSVANALARLRITPRKVCSGTFSCMDASAFNARYLSVHYPSDTLYRILNGEPIFGGEHLVKTRHGFTQRLRKKGKYDITYRVLKNRVEFRDTINHIVISVEKGTHK